MLRRVKNGCRCSFLNDHTFINEHDPVGHLAGKAHFMGHDHHRHAFLGQGLHDRQHFADHLGVQRGRGLVEQHDARLHRQRPGNRHALLLAA